jgi:thioredoxin-related protein
MHLLKSRFAFLILLFLASFLPASAQLAQYCFEQVDSLQQVAPRPVFVFIHTNWCRYCAQMEATTLQNKKVVEQLNQKVYFVSLDAESREDISFYGGTFKYRPTGRGTGSHQLAELLGTIEGQMALPGICILNAKGEIVFQQGGAVPAKVLLRMLGTLPAK